ncbi:MAG TPA: hypothetical protein VFO07_11745 [Roseiflexaceae bacterium]|nr:hypothetical protein [Roseiflexaceae bacterium]
MRKPTGALWDALKDAGVTVQRASYGWAAHAGPAGVSGYATAEEAIGALVALLIGQTRQNTGADDVL